MKHSLLYERDSMLRDIDPNIEATFNWAQWTPNTSLKLCNVPWDSSYRDLARFESPQKQQEWFDRRPGIDRVHGVMHMFGQPVRVELPFNEASNYNYVVVYNDYPDLEAPRYWYYFINHVEYINAYTTQLTVQLDVWQSFQHVLRFGSCYVVRGHIGIANENQMTDYGRSYLALPEGLDTGSEMVTVNQQYKSLISMDGKNLNYGVIVVSTVDLSADAGNQEKPSLTTAGGSLFENMANGAEILYFKDIQSIQVFMGVGSTFSWITQGIVSMYMIPSLDDDFLKQSGYVVDKLFGKTLPSELNNRIYRFPQSATNAPSRYEDIITINDFRDNFNIPKRYKNLKKLKCYPYSTVECTCLNGTNITYKPENIQSDNLVIREVHNYAPNGARLNFYPVGYNKAGASEIAPLDKNNGLPIDSGEMLDAAFGISNFPQFVIVNNGAQLAMANSAYTRSYSQQSADWAYQKAQMGISQSLAATAMQNQYNTQANKLAIGNRNANNAIQATSLNTSLDNTTYINNQRADLAQLNNVVNGVVGVAGGAASGNVGGAVSALGGAVMNGVNTEANRSINNTAAQLSTANSLSTNAATTSQANTYGSQTTALSNQLAQNMADMNADYAQRSAFGDYQNTIAGINAQVQQMQLTPPTTSGAIGGDGFNLANGIVGVLVRFKTCAPSALRSVGEYMLRYGYFIQRFITPPQSLECMTKFTYWQMQECYVRGDLPEQYRQTIKGVFESGATIWTNPDDIGVTDWADNDPLPGISF